MKMKTIFRSLGALGCVLLAVLPARALDWEKTAITLKPEKDAQVVRTRFEFKNTGAKPVRILGIRTSCSCTEADTPSSEIAPGASGTVFVLFTVGKRTGLQEKEILLFTDESSEAKKLTLRVELPERKAGS